MSRLVEHYTRSRGCRRGSAIILFNTFLVACGGSQVSDTTEGEQTVANEQQAIEIVVNNTQTVQGQNSISSVTSDVPATLNATPEENTSENTPAIDTAPLQVIVTVSPPPVMSAPLPAETIASESPVAEKEKYPRYHAQAVAKLYFANRLNNAGDIAGQITSEHTKDGHDHAAVWRNGVVEDLGVYGCSFNNSSCYSRAYSLNNNGVVVGSSIVSNSGSSFFYGYFGTYYPHEVRWYQGTVSIVPSLGTEVGVVYDINDSNTMVGTSRSTFYNGNFSADYILHGFVSIGGGSIHEIGIYNQYSSAHAVNSENVVTGEIEVDSKVRAFMWQNKETKVLPSLGGETSSGSDISNNKNPMVVGFSTTKDSATHAALWTVDNVVDLNVLDGTSWSKARAVNDEGIVVGVSGFRATVWYDRVAVDLTSRTDLEAPLRLYNAIDINNAGQILAEGDGGRYYLLTPIQ